MTVEAVLAGVEPVSAACPSRAWLFPAALSPKSRAMVEEGGAVEVLVLRAAFRAAMTLSIEVSGGARAIPDVCGTPP